MRTRLGWTVWAVVGLAGCAQWPRFAHPIGQGDASQQPGDTDPTTLVTTSWTQAAEAEINDLPTDDAVARASLAPGLGVEVSGVLDLAGWDSTATPVAIEDDACAGSSGVRTAGVEAGDYLGDVDFFLVDATEDGVLCAAAEVAVDGPDRGWDLLAFPADACGVPGAPIEGADGPVGYGLGGEADGWSIPVSQGDRVAILLSSYAPNAPEGAFAYRLGLSMVAASSAGVAPVCPALPAE